MRSFLLLALLALLSIGTASAGWFGGGSPEARQDNVSTFKKDLSKAFGSGKLAGKEKIAEAKAKAKEVEQKAQKSAKEAAKKLKKTKDDAVEEGKGLLGDIRTRYGRLFAKSK